MWINIFLGKQSFLDLQTPKLTWLIQLLCLTAELLLQCCCRSSWCLPTYSTCLKIWPLPGMSFNGYNYCIHCSQPWWLQSLRLHDATVTSVRSGLEHNPAVVGERALEIEPFFMQLLIWLNGKLIHKDWHKKISLSHSTSFYSFPQLTRLFLSMLYCSDYN